MQVFTVVERESVTKSGCSNTPSKLILIRDNTCNVNHILNVHFITTIFYAGCHRPKKMKLSKFK